jgi:DNA-binding PadR family transcriptional regulator
MTTHAHTYAGPAGGRCAPEPDHLRRTLGRFMRAMEAGGERGRHGRRGRRGPGGPGFGFAFEGGPRRRGPRARRGDVRAAALLLLAEEPRNGYAIMQEIEQRTDGLWRPSPGAVYPALSQLEDEGLIRADEHDGRRVYALTDEGRAYVEQRRGELVAPWDAVNAGVDDQVWELMQRGREFGMTLFQIVHSGSDQQIAQAREVLEDARRSLYRILAGEAGEGGEGGEPGGQPGESESEGQA